MYEGAMSRYWMNEVIMCHGSNFEHNVRDAGSGPSAEDGQLTKMRDARMYKPSVASNEITMFRKMEFPKRLDTDSGPSDFTRLSMPLNARKKAAI